MRSAIEQYRRWFEYEKDAHAKVLQSLEAVPAEGRSSPAYGRAVDILAHIAVGRQLWLFRLGGAKEMPPNLFLEGAELPDVVATLAAAHEAWTAYLAGLTDEDLAREFEYTAWVGGRYRSRVEDVLTQMYGHSLYHRGQIAMLVRTAGGKPAETDFIFWSRTPLDAPHQA